jgi:peptidoglycan/LPS O-acetylase OafA/YrhL
VVHSLLLLLSLWLVVGLVVVASSKLEKPARSLNRRLALRAIFGAVLLGAGAATVLKLCGLRDPSSLVIYSSMYAAAGAVAGIASLWRERGLPAWTCAAVVAACILVARLTTVLVVGFRKFNNYPQAPTVIAAVVGVLFVLLCRKPVVGGGVETSE